MHIVLFNLLDIPPLSNFSVHISFAYLTACFQFSFEFKIAEADTASGFNPILTAQDPI